jgi:hypothetical protein
MYHRYSFFPAVFSGGRENFSPQKKESLYQLYFRQIPSRTRLLTVTPNTITLQHSTFPPQKILPPHKNLITHKKQAHHLHTLQVIHLHQIILQPLLFTVTHLHPPPTTLRHHYPMTVINLRQLLIPIINLQLLSPITSHLPTNHINQMTRTLLTHMIKVFLFLCFILFFNSQTDDPYMGSPLSSIYDTPAESHPPQLPLPSQLPLPPPLPLPPFSSHPSHSSTMLSPNIPLLLQVPTAPPVSSPSQLHISSNLPPLQQTPPSLPPFK